VEHSEQGVLAGLQPGRGERPLIGLGDGPGSAAEVETPTVRPVPSRPPCPPSPCNETDYSNCTDPAESFERGSVIASVQTP
jgi:hypothetical protein